jgi:uncharacterized protein (DUF305 family)
MNSLRQLLPAVAFALLSAACAGGGSDTGTAPRAEPASSQRPDDETLAELEALFEARQAEALEDVHPADVDFVTGMIGHHAQALVMSGYAPDAGADPEIRTLAARIINAQKDEIALMQRWLRDRGRPVPEVASDGSVRMPEGTMDHAAMGHGRMPGMLSPEQLQELSRAREDAFGRLFLQYMIQHHQGAVTMVHELFAVDGAAQDEAIFKIASDIQVDQITEINRMQRMLDARTSGGA